LDCSVMCHIVHQQGMWLGLIRVMLFSERCCTELQPSLRYVTRHVREIYHIVVQLQEQL